MPKYILHIVEENYYSVPVEAKSSEEAEAMYPDLELGNHHKNGQNFVESVEEVK